MSPHYENRLYSKLFVCITPRIFNLHLILLLHLNKCITTFWFITCCLFFFLSFDSRSNKAHCDSHICWRGVMMSVRICSNKPSLNQDELIARLCDVGPCELPLLKTNFCPIFRTSDKNRTKIRDSDNICPIFRTLEAYNFR